MAISNPYQYQQYQQQQVFTAPPDKLLLMLFDGAIRFCNQAKKALGGKKLEEGHHYIMKAENIILELMTSLKMDFAFSQQLYALYEYLYRRLVKANIEKDVVLLDEVIELLTELRQTWAEVAAKVRETRKLVVGGGGLEG
ncbi:MAG: flagellar export chaperone FliS [Clostridia bacterium]|jgi:flagellar protein FliS|nr:flagellar export chaperone FliS [Clostridia bacterium]